VRHSNSPQEISLMSIMLPLTATGNERMMLS